MPGKVHKTAMSPVATSHMLIAAGTEDVQVRLCDISSGAFAHTLSGHRGMAISISGINKVFPFAILYLLHLRNKVLSSEKLFLKSLCHEVLLVFLAPKNKF